MKVAYIGNFREPYCTEVHISKTLNDLNVETVNLQEDELTIRKLDKELSKDVNILLYTRTWGLKERKQFLSLLEELRGSGITSASYHLDLYYGIKRQSSLDGDPFWATEFVFTPDGDPAAQSFFESRGINHHYIKPGVFKGECGFGRFKQEYSCDVVFVGSVEGYHGEWPYRKELHKWLSRNFKGRYKKFGHPEGVVRNQNLNNLYASAKVVIGDSLCPGFDKPYYWSDRIYETSGRGGFLVHPYIKGLEEEFTDGHDVVFYEFGNFKELKAKIEHYLDNEDERNLIRQNALDNVTQNCTYHNRLTEAFDRMGLKIGG